MIDFSKSSVTFRSSSVNLEIAKIIKFSNAIRESANLKLKDGKNDGTDCIDRRNAV